MIREQKVTLTIRYDDSALLTCKFAAGIDGLAPKEAEGQVRVPELLPFDEIIERYVEGVKVTGIEGGDLREVFDVEVTDTFGGEANYSWVRRYTIACDNDAHDGTVIRAAKKAAGWNGMACRTEKWGDGTIALYQRGAAVVMFITPRTDGPLGD